MHDVVIVGAGPAGSSAAHSFAREKFNVLVVDKKQEIGVPKRCGEGLSLRWFELANLKPDKRWCCQKTNGAIIYSPSGKKIVISTDKTTGYIIERKMFEKHLAERAIRAGAKYRLKTYAYDVIKEEGEQVKGIRVINDQGEKEEIRAKLTIAADGIESTIARKAGLKTFLPYTEGDCGYQYEMVNMKIEDPRKIILYFGTEVAPRGYIWIFPKGKDVANVGIGIHSKEGGSAKKYLDSFITAHPKIFRNASITEINGGMVSVGAVVEHPVKPGFIAIGDAAHMINPVHGGGIGTSLEAGILAAEVCAPLVRQNELSERDLEAFSKRWMRVRGNEMRRILRVRQFFERLTDEQIERLADMVDPNDLYELSHGRKLTKLAKLLIKTFPKAAGFAWEFATHKE